MIKINLIPAEYIEKVNRKVLIAKAAIAATLVVLTLAGVSVYHVTSSKRTDELLAEKKKELKSLQGDVDKVKKIEADINEVKKYLGAIKQISKSKYAYVYFMQDILVGLPGTIWFSSINTSSKDNKMSLAFNLKSRSALDLAYWINFLEKDKKFSNIDIGSISIGESDGAKTLTLSVKAEYGG